MSAPRELNARNATLAFVINILAQFVVGGAICVIFIVIAMMQSKGEVDRLHDEASRLVPIATILATAICGVLTVWTLNVLMPRTLKSTEPTGVAWTRGKWSDLAKGLMIGCALGILVMVWNRIMKNQMDYSKLGPTDRMALTPGWTRIVWAIAAVVIIPPYEELLFRGILYGGYRKSLGPTWAAVITTVLFVLMHVPRVVYYPRAIVSLTAFALVALWCRLRWKAIGPAIAVHAGSNLVASIRTFIVLSV